MANYMKEVTMLLGLELDKEFNIEEHKGKFRITENGVEVFYDKEEGWRSSEKISLDFILTGRYIIEKKWKPQEGAPYYIPCIVAQPEYMYSVVYWRNDDYDKEYYRMGLVCNTPEKAINMTMRMLDTVKEARNDG